MDIWRIGLMDRHIGLGFERVKAVPPGWKPREHSTAQPMTVGQTAGRSGRDPHHVALSSHTALTPLVNEAVNLLGDFLTMATVQVPFGHVWTGSVVNCRGLLPRMSVVQDD